MTTTDAPVSLTQPKLEYPLLGVMLTGREVDLLCVGGSHLYGLSHPESDYDYWGFAVPSPHDMLGLDPFTHYNSLQEDPDDRVVLMYRTGASPKKRDVDLNLVSVHKFCKGLLGNNIQFLELLHAPTEFIVTCSVIGQAFIRDREKFVSKGLFPKYRGYAQGEWRKITDGDGEKRKADIVEYGYARKNATHCIRLLMEGTVLLSGAGLTFPLPDNEHELLLEIANGNLSMEALSQEYNRWERILEVAYESSPLPERVRLDDVRSLLLDACRIIALNTYGVEKHDTG